MHRLQHRDILNIYFVATQNRPQGPRCVLCAGSALSRFIWTQIQHDSTSELNWLPPKPVAPQWFRSRSFLFIFFNLKNSELPAIIYKQTAGNTLLSYITMWFMLWTGSHSRSLIVDLFVCGQANWMQPWHCCLRLGVFHQHRHCPSCHRVCHTHTHANSHSWTAPCGAFAVCFSANVA